MDFRYADADFRCYSCFYMLQNKSDESNGYSNMIRRHSMRSTAGAGTGASRQHFHPDGKDRGQYDGGNAIGLVGCGRGSGTVIGFGFAPL
jgi:hypothetical protein